MTKQEFKEICDLSFLALGDKYAWQKLRSVKGKPKFYKSNKGLVSGKQIVNPKGPKPPAFTARRMPLSVEGVKHYLKTTLEMKSKMQQELEAKKNEGGR